MPKVHRTDKFRRFVHSLRKFNGITESDRVGVMSNAQIQRKLAIAFVDQYDFKRSYCQFVRTSIKVHQQMFACATTHLHTHSLVHVRARARAHKCYAWVFKHERMFRIGPPQYLATLHISAIHTYTITRWRTITHTRMHECVHTETHMHLYTLTHTGITVSQPHAPRIDHATIRPSSHHCAKQFNNVQPVQRVTLACNSVSPRSSDLPSNPPSSSFQPPSPTVHSCCVFAWKRKHYRPDRLQDDSNHTYTQLHASIGNVP